MNMRLAGIILYMLACSSVFIYWSTLFHQTYYIQVQLSHYLQIIVTTLFYLLQFGSVFAYIGIYIAWQKKYKYFKSLFFSLHLFVAFLLFGYLAIEFYIVRYAQQALQIEGEIVGADMIKFYYSRNYLVDYNVLGETSTRITGQWDKYIASHPSTTNRVRGVGIYRIKDSDNHHVVFLDPRMPPGSSYLQNLKGHKAEIKGRQCFLGVVYDSLNIDDGPLIEMTYDPSWNNLLSNPSQVVSFNRYIAEIHRHHSFSY